jgi:hypothetical protein
MIYVLICIKKDGCSPSENKLNQHVYSAFCRARVVPEIRFFLHFRVQKYGDFALPSFLFIDKGRGVVNNETGVCSYNSPHLSFWCSDFPSAVCIVYEAQSCSNKGEKFVPFLRN